MPVCSTSSSFANNPLEFFFFLSFVACDEGKMEEDKKEIWIHED